MEGLIMFKHIERPKDLPLNALQALFEFLGLPPGLIVNQSAREDGVKQLQDTAGKLLERTLRAQQAIQQELSLWDISLFDEKQKTALRDKLSKLKEFLESLRVFNTPGKLKNFSYSEGDINKHKEGKHPQQGGGSGQLASEIQPFLSYLGTAEAVFSMMPVDGEPGTSVGSQTKRPGSTMDHTCALRRAGTGILNQKST